MSALSFTPVVVFILIICSTMVYPRVVKMVDDPLNNKPIIGILAQHTHPDNPIPLTGDSYISASYVKFLESAGARVVPIKINQHPETVSELLSSINGVLFPGGDADIANSAYQKNAKMVYDYAIQERNKGKVFPVWGTCLGFQQLAALVAGSDSVLSLSSGTWDVSMNLSDLDKTGRMVENMSSDLFHAATVEPLTYNAHYNCVSVDTFNNNGALKDFFKVLSTNVDANGKLFISTVEAHNFPIYATQWHPEMNMFEFNVGEGLGTNINHSINGIRIAQHFASFFVNEARKNFNTFPSKIKERSHLIYNYNPIYSAMFNSFDEQVYIF